MADHLGGTLVDYVRCFSESYTSLGFGDRCPAGARRLLTGIEALNGHLLIGRSAAFTYLVMERAWRI